MRKKTVNTKLCNEKFEKHTVFGSLTINGFVPGFMCAVTALSFLKINEAMATTAAPIKITVKAGDTTIFGKISDDATNPGAPLEKSGPGDLISLLSTHTGSTTISEGRLFAMGSFGATGQPVIVANGATLAGSGPFLGNIQNSGVLSPSAGGVSVRGIVVAPMMITGSVSQTDGGITRLYFDPKRGDRITTTNAIDFSNSGLEIVPKPGYYPSPSTISATVPIVQHTALSWLTGTAVDDSKIIFPTATPGTPNYLELTITPIRTITGQLSFTFQGVDKTLPVENTDAATLTSVTGAIIAPSGATVSASEGTTSAIATKFVIADGGLVNVAPATNSTMEFSGEIAGGNLNLAGAGDGSAVKFTSDNPDYAGTVAATGVKATFNGDMSNTAVLAGAGSLISGSGSIGAVSVSDATLKPGNSVGTSTFASLDVTSTTHYIVEMNDTAANKIEVSGNTSLGPEFIVDALMDAGRDTVSFDNYGNPINPDSAVIDRVYPVGVTSRPILTAGGTLTGNVHTLTWMPQAGLEFDIGLDTGTKTISLVSTITAPVTISADQTVAGTITRRILTDLTSTAASLSGYDYISLIGSTLTAGAETVANTIFKKV